MNIKIEKKSYKPISQQIKEQIKERINKGILKEGEILPPVNYFQELLGISHKPIRKALLELKEENLLYSRRGSGWYVAGEQKIKVSDRKETNFEDTLQDIPFAYIVRKKQLTIGLMDTHPEQVKMWQDVFFNLKKIDRYLEIKLVPYYEEGDKDILQVNYSRLGEDREKYLELSRFKAIQNINFSDIFDIFLKPIMKGKGILGLPSFVSFPLIFLNKKFEGEFEKIMEKEKQGVFSWEDYLTTAVNYVRKNRNLKDGFILSHLTPFSYFLINGVEPFRTTNGKVILGLDDERVLSVFKDLQMMGENYCYVEREIERKGIDAKVRFLKGELPLMESLIFERNYLKEASIGYRILRLPCSKEGKIPISSSYWAISSRSKHKRICTEILSYLLSPSAQRIIARHNRFPVLKSIAYSDYFSPPEKDNKNAQVFSVEKGISFDNWEETFHLFLNEAFNYEVDKLLNRLQSVEETIENLKEEAKIHNEESLLESVLVG